MDDNKLPRLDNRSKEELICNILLNYAFKNKREGKLRFFYFLYIKRVRVKLYNHYSNCYEANANN